MVMGNGLLIFCIEMYEVHLGEVSLPGATPSRIQSQMKLLRGAGMAQCNPVRECRNDA